MFSEHWSDCALHSGPARFPMPCDCAGLKGGTRSGSASYHWGYTWVVAVRNIGQLWRARLVWLRENHEIPARCRLKAAMRKASGHRRGRSRQYEAPPS